jgi:uncharacterized phage infection (PIP) family protein YhgE
MTFSGSIPIEEKLLISLDERLDRCIDAVREGAMETMALNLTNNNNNNNNNSSSSDELGDDAMTLIQTEIKSLHDTYHDLLQDTIRLTSERDGLEKSLRKTLEDMAALNDGNKVDKDDDEDEVDKEDEAGDGDNKEPHSEEITSDNLFKSSKKKMTVSSLRSFWSTSKYEHEYILGDLTPPPHNNNNNKTCFSAHIHIYIYIYIDG